MPARTARSRKTRDRIASIAADVIGEVGYARATLEAVAERARVTRGTVYYHYDSKEELYAAALCKIMSDFDRAIEAVAATPAPPIEQLAACIRVMFEAASGENRRYQPLPEPGLLPPERMAEVTELRRRYEGRVAAIIRAAQESGDVVAGDPAILARILITSVGRVARWFDPTGSVSQDEIVRTLGEVFLCGLMTRTDSDALPP